MLSANYLWSHSIDEGSVGGNNNLSRPQNANCRHCDRASSDADIRHTISVNSVYELPFGRGRRYLPTGGTLGALAGGWEMSGIVTARTGQPVNITISRRAADLPDQNSGSTQRPNLAPGVSLIPAGGKTAAQWINPAAFALPSPGAWGNAGRNLARGPGQFQIDTALTKRILVTERLNFEIRAEAFNLLNQPQYSAPQANLSSSANFGRITNVLNTGATGTGTPRQFQLALRLNF